MRRPRQVIALFGLFLLTSTLGSSLALAAQTVHVDLLDNDDGSMAIATSVESLPVGKVTFEVTNKSNDVEHEFLIAQLKVAPENVPFDDSRGIVKESALDGVKELGDLAPGKSSAMTLNLKAGKYLLFCNMPGHYKDGMYHVLNVTQ
jgi:uncharacterized cupredoxin-like copper-binding protein